MAKVELLTVDQSSGYLHISSVTFRRLLKKKIIKYYKIGKSVRIDLTDLNKYLDSNRV